MADQKKIAEEIKSKGFAIAKCDMNDESPDEWVMFGVWFYLKQNFYVDLDWRIGKYYFYLESTKEEVKEKEPKNKSLDVYSAESFLSPNLLKHYNVLKGIADTIHSSGIYITEDRSIIDIVDEEDNKAVLFWIVDEYGDESIVGVYNDEQPLMMLASIEHQDKISEEAKRRGLEVIKVKPDWAFDDDDIEVDKVVGFEEIDFYF